MSLSVNECLNGKNLLLTGATGFLGKVLLEKVLRDIPEVNKIFLLVRGKNPQERIKTEVFSTKLFSRLYKQKADFDQYWQSKVVAVRGDVLEQNLGLSEKDYELLKSNVHFVVHCAATVDFKERLDAAIKKNVLGSLQLLEISKSFNNITGFIHVSTAYVNCNRAGHHKEVLPPLNFDPEEMVQLILQMNPNELENRTQSIIGTYPNTYTFSKAITEHLLFKRRGDLPMSFVRPTIIGASYEEPFPGWIDSVNAIASVVLYSGVGLVRFVYGYQNLITDVVPVDSVSNVILAAIPAALAKPKDLMIYHVGTSHANPVTWSEIRDYVSLYWRQHNVARRVDHRPLHFVFYKHRWSFETAFFLRNTVPAQLYSIYAKTIGTSQQKKNAELLKKINYRTYQTTSTFEHFTTSEWIYETQNTEALLELFTDEQKNKYDWYVPHMNWEQYFRFFSWGMQRFILKEDVKPPTYLLKSNLVGEPRKQMENTFWTDLFPDLAWAYKGYKTNIGIDNFATLRTPQETKNLIIRSKKVQDVIKKLAENEKISVEKVEARAHQVLDRMTHTLHLPVVRMLGYFLKKVFRQMYQGIHVDERGIEMIRKSLNQGPLILIPTHRSYLDFLIVSYIFFEYDLPMPHIAAGEDFLGIFFVNWVFRNSGAFFLRRSFKGDLLYTTLFSEYVQRLVQDWSPIEFFIEGKRSRTGKCLHPKFGLLSNCLEPFFQKKVPDLTIVPISIAYEKVVEAELYSSELLGEKKVKETFSGLLAARKILNMNFGRINVVFNQPISVKDFAENGKLQVSQQVELLAKPILLNTNNNPINNSNVTTNNNNNNSNSNNTSLVTTSSSSNNNKNGWNVFHHENERREFTKELAYQIVYELNKGIVITGSALVATVVLTFRKGLTNEDLLAKVDWLREEIEAKGTLVAYEGTTQELVDNAIKLLGPQLVSKVRNIYAPTKNPGDPARKNASLLLLSLYRNQLIHLFFNEALIALVMSSHFVMSTNEGISREKLIQEALFLADLLWLEFVTKSSTEGMRKTLEQVVQNMLERGILKEKSGKEKEGKEKESKNLAGFIRVSKEGEGQLAFLCNMFWPLIDSYWAAGISLFSMQPNVSLKLSTLVQRTQLICEKMYSEGKIFFYESCAMEVLNNAFHLLEKRKVVQLKHEQPSSQVQANKRNVNANKKAPPSDPLVSLLPPYQKEAAVQELIEHIQMFRKSSVGTGASGSENAGANNNVAKLRRAVIYDFPVLAKL